MSDEESDAKRTAEKIAGEQLAGIMARSKTKPPPGSSWTKKTCGIKQGEGSRPLTVTWPKTGVVDATPRERTFTQSPALPEGDSYLNLNYNERSIMDVPAKKEPFMDRIGKGWKLVIVFILGFLLYAGLSLVQDYFAEKRLARKVSVARATKDINDLSSSAPSQPVAPVFTQPKVALKSPYSNPESVTMASCGSEGNSSNAQVFTKGLSADPGCAWVEVRFAYGVYMMEGVGGFTIEFPSQKDIVGMAQCSDPETCVRILNHIDKNPSIPDKKVLLRVGNNVGGSGYSKGFLKIR